MYEWEIAWKSHKLWSVNITSSWCHLTCRIPDICTDWNWTIWQYQDLADWLKHKALSSIYVSCKDSWMANDVKVEQSWGIFLPLDMTNLSRSWKMYEMILIWWMGSTDGYIAQLNSLRARSSNKRWNWQQTGWNWQQRGWKAILQANVAENIYHLVTSGRITLTWITRNSCRKTNEQAVLFQLYKP